MRDLEVACFKANSSKDLSNRPIYAVLNTHSLDMILQHKVSVYPKIDNFAKF